MQAFGEEIDVHHTHIQREQLCFGTLLTSANSSLMFGSTVEDGGGARLSHSFPD